MSDHNSSLHFLKPFYRGLPIIVLVVAVAVLAAKRYLRYTTPMYESTAKIKLADTRDGIPNSQLYKDFDVFTSSNKIGAELELIRSEALIEKMIARVDLTTSIYRVGEIHKKELYTDSPIIINPLTVSAKEQDKIFTLLITQKDHINITTPLNKQLSGRLGDTLTNGTDTICVTINNALLQQKPYLQIEDHYEFITHSAAHLVNEIVANLDVTSVDKDIPIVRVSYKSPVAQKSADIVNAVSETYINDYIEEKYKSADTTENFLTRQLEDYSSRLSASESNIQNYRNARNIINTHQETETDLRKIADLKKQLASVQMNLEAIDSLNTYIRKGKDHFTDLAPNFEAFTDLLSTEIIKNIKLLQAERKDLLTRYTPGNEKVIVVDQKIQDLSMYLQESIRNTETNLRIKYNNLKQTIALSEQEFIGLPEKEKTMTILERNFGLNEQTYRFLQEKRTEAQIAKAATISFHRIIARGEVPVTPVSPNAKLLTVFSGFLAFIFSLIGIFMVHAAKARTDNEVVIYRNTDTPLEKSIPFTNTAAEKENIFTQWALEMELNNQLRPGTTICITSLNKDEGKSYVATGLANAIAALGKQVLLVGMDKDFAGTTNTTVSTQTANDIAAHWKIPAEWKKEIDKRTAQFDVIIFKNMAMKDSTLGILPMAEASVNFFLLDSRLTRIKDINTADELKQKMNLQDMRYVLNRAGYVPGLHRHLKKMIARIRNKP